MPVVDLKCYVKLLRPVQWLKNLMIYFPPFLGGSLFSTFAHLSALLPFMSFCLASSATYVFNDLLDIDNDRNHPEKRLRPLPACKVSIVSAYFLVFALVCGAIGIGLMVSGPFLLFLLAYFCVSSAYSIWLKNHALADIFCIAAGFLLRLEAGGTAFNVQISDWLLLSVFLLAIFLSTGKRLSEKNSLGAVADSHRRALAKYPEGFLNGIMFMTGGAVLVTYTMYVISRHSSLLIFTVPLCCFGLLRYILRIQTGKSGDPTESLTRDIPLFAVGLLWAVMVGWGIYAR
jgi:decaprenyl-phosphate phosphoribosyltransferase